MKVFTGHNYKIRSACLLTHVVLLLAALFFTASFFTKAIAAEPTPKEKEEAFWRQRAKQGVLAQQQKLDTKKQKPVRGWQQKPAQPSLSTKNNWLTIHGSGSLVVSKKGSLTAQGQGLFDVDFSGLLPASTISVNQLRLDLIARYIEMGEVEKALAVADKVQDRLELVHFLLEIENKQFQTQLLDYAAGELHRIKNTKKKSPTPVSVGKKNPINEFGKAWAMTTLTELTLKALEDIDAITSPKGGKE